MSNIIFYLKELFTYNLNFRNRYLKYEKRIEIFCTLGPFVPNKVLKFASNNIDLLLI